VYQGDDSDPLQQVKGEGNGCTNQGNQADVTKSATISFGWIPSVVAVSVENTADKPQGSCAGTQARMLQTSKHKQHQKHGVYFQCVLMSALNAVEHRFFITVHVWILYSESFPCSTHINSKILHQNDRGKTDENNPAKLGGDCQINRCHRN